jgi:uncharacterized protein involved in exopolysaccharide biosynthesis
VTGTGRDRLKFYFSLFLRRLHYFLIVLTLGTVVGLTLAWMLPPVYMAEARLVVESEQIPGELAASTVQIAATEQLQIIQQRILTRDTLIEMANRLQIYAPLRDNQSANWLLTRSSRICATVYRLSPQVGRRRAALFRPPSCRSGSRHRQRSWQLPSPMRW